MSEARPLYHLDCVSGLAGDMFLGACLDLGMPVEVLEESVAALGLTGVSVECRSARRGGLVGTRFRVLKDGVPIEGPDPEEATDRATHGVGPGCSHTHEPARDLQSIRSLIRTSGLEPAVRDHALGLFERLGQVEAEVHGVEIDRVHFHEVGALDSIVDLVGAAAAWEHLGLERDRVSCGTVVTGSGRVSTDHGVLPVPAPATARLLVGVPTIAEGSGELLTPTGALLIDRFVGSFGPAPAMTVEGHGYGLGRWDPPDRPNVVRLTRGSPDLGSAGDHEVTVIEAEVDDASGEIVGSAMERLFAIGALDVYVTPVQMKKGRPGSLITVLGRPEREAALATTLLAETGSFGCRWHRARRIEIERVHVTVETRYGAIGVKVGRLGGDRHIAAPEYEDCRRCADQHDVPVREVFRAAVVAFDRERPQEI